MPAKLTVLGDIGSYSCALPFPMSIQTLDALFRYKKELRRDFGFLSSFCSSLNLLCWLSGITGQ